MARYKGNYRDRFFKDATATYTITYEETKTVTGESNNYFRPGMSLTTKSGKIKIEADTLNETYTSLDHRNIKRAGYNGTVGNITTKSFIGGNINLYGLFFLTCGNTNSLGTIVTSNGKRVWRNKNVIQFLVTGVNREWSNQKLTKSDKRTYIAGMAWYKSASTWWNTNKVTKYL